MCFLLVKDLLKLDWDYVYIYIYACWCCICLCISLQFYDCMDHSTEALIMLSRSDLRGERIPSFRMQSRSHHCSLRIPRVLYGMDGMYIPKKSSPFISFLRSIIFTVMKCGSRWCSKLIFRDTRLAIDRPKSCSFQRRGERLVCLGVLKCCVPGFGRYPDIPVKGVEFLWIKGATECNNCILVYMASKYQISMPLLD